MRREFPQALAPWLLVAGIMSGAAGAEARGQQDADFTTAIGPLLIRRCVGCHNEMERKGGLDLTQREAAMAGGDSGPAIVRGEPDESLLWQRVSAGDMPPKKPLAADEQAVLRRWIETGSPWNDAVLDPWQVSSDERAGYDWWSLQPLRTVALAPPRERSGVRSAIDVSVRARLEESGLSPSEEADRRVLIRRLYFDLLGLPPAPEEVEEFVADKELLAYERLVERLLASPHYGERWARHWLDIVRFGESQGFERDKLRPHAWRYRDWVVGAWNCDLPYRDFARLQLAGDVLAPEDPAAIIATGCLVAGPYDEVGQLQQSEAMRRVVREDELEDVVSTVGQTFLGLTVHCSRCHDHKFDPVRQVEYYQLAAAVAGVRHGEREVAAAAMADAAQTRAAQAGSRIRLLEARVADLEAPIRQRVVAERRLTRGEGKPAVPLAAWEFDGRLDDSAGELHGEGQGAIAFRDGQLILTGKEHVATARLTRDLREKTLEAWVRLADLNQAGGAVLGVQTVDGNVFDAIVYGEREPRRWMAGSNAFVRTKSFEGEDEHDAGDRTIHVAIVYCGDGTVIGYRNGRRYGTPYATDGPVVFPAHQSQVLIGLRHSPPAGDRLLRGAVERVRLYDRALTDAEIAISAGDEYLAVSEQELIGGLTPDERGLRDRWRMEIRHLEEERERWLARKVYAVVPQPPSDTFVLRRGNPAQPSPPALPGGIAALRGLPPDFQLSAESSDGERRRRLAEWITDERNPLFARVMVNRLWQYHFGAGLIETPNDFGFQGGHPSHPELLDWLAGELVRSGWSLKHLHRQMVCSATYRQASRFRPDAARTDAANRLLWRRTPWRLEAEVLRDALLMLAGELVTDLGGPGYYDFTTYTRNTQFYEMRDPIGASFQRRSIYRTWVRSGRSPLLDVFDCPDPSTKTPQRAVTTTPLQALTLLNNSFVLRMADRFAARVQRETGDDPDAQVCHAFRHALAREPDDVERPACAALVRQEGLAALCRVLFNSNEFLYVD